MKNVEINMMTALQRMYKRQSTRIFGASNIEYYIKKYALKGRDTVGRTSVAQYNRHTGRPHEHKREIARRRRQQGVA